MTVTYTHRSAILDSVNMNITTCCVSTLNTGRCDCVCGLVGLGWCCLVEVFSGLVVDLGDDSLQFFPVGCSLKVGACGQR